MAVGHRVAQLANAHWRATLFLGACLALATFILPLQNAHAALQTCDESGLDAAILAGGSHTFDCAGATTVTVGSTKIIPLGENITLDGGGLLTLSGGDSLHIFTISNGATLTLDNLALTNGDNAANGGAIVNSGMLNLNNSVVKNSVATNGGGIYNNGQLTLSASQVIDNIASNSGGGIAVAGFGVVTTENASVISRNTATGGDGGGLHNSESGFVSLNSSVFQDNRSLAGEGGAVHNAGTNVTMSVTMVNFGGNSAASHGGGVYQDAGAGALQIRESEFWFNNAASTGGGLYSHSAELSVTVSIFSNNLATVRGGGLEIAGGTATISDTQILNNMASEGGGIAAEGVISLDIVNSALLTNTASLGGALFVSASNASVFDTTIANNNALNGGGIWNAGSLDVRQSLLMSNHALSQPNDQDIPDGGGGIFALGSLLIENVTFNANTTSGAGGALFVADTGATVDIVNATMAQNLAAAGGGIASDGNLPTLSNSIVADNTNGDCFGAILPINANLDSDTSCGASITSPPLLDALANNGGATQTMALLAGSPALNSALNCPPPSVDQRGIVRPQGGGCDLGAYESVPPANTPPVAMNNSYEMNADEVLIINTLGILSDDSDPENNPLSAQLVDGTVFGVLNFPGDGGFTYDPLDDFGGDDTFTYRAFDGLLQSNLAIVTITVNPVDNKVGIDPLPPVCEPNPVGDLVGWLEGGGSGVVVNNSDACEYDVGIAAYMMFDNIVDNQRLHSAMNPVRILPGETVFLSTNLPGCAVQIDLFFGELLQSLNGIRYGERLLAVGHEDQANLCTR